MYVSSQRACWCVYCGVCILWCARNASLGHQDGGACPQKALRGGIPSPVLEPFPRYWSQFVENCCKKLTNLVNLDLEIPPRRALRGLLSLTILMRCSLQPQLKMWQDDPSGGLCVGRSVFHCYLRHQRFHFCFGTFHFRLWSQWAAFLRAVEKQRTLPNTVWVPGDHSGRSRPSFSGGAHG